MLDIENYDIAFSADPESDGEKEVMILVIERGDLPSFTNRPKVARLNEDYSGSKTLDIYFEGQDEMDEEQSPTIKCLDFPENLFSLISDGFDEFWMCTVDGDEVCSEDKISLIK